MTLRKVHSVIKTGWQIAIACTSAYDEIEEKGLFQYVSGPIWPN